MNKKNILFLLLLFIIFGGLSCSNSSSNLGVFKSNDRGDNWSQKVKIDDKKTIKKENIISMTINPNDSQVIYIGSREKGMYRTSDGGESWQTTPIASGRVHTIDIDPKNPDTVYVAGYFGTLGKIYKSTDNGQNFQETYSETHEKIEITDLAIDSYDTRKIYAGTSEGVLLKSTDGGRSWILKQELDNSIVSIAINPEDTRYIMIGTATSGIYKTEDGGDKVVSLDDKIKEAFGRKTSKVRSIFYDPVKSGKIYFSSLEGLLVSEDGGENWKKIDILTEIESKGTFEVAVNNDSSSIFLGIDSAIYRSDDEGQSWQVNRITDGYIEVIACDPNDNQTIYAGIAKLESN